VYKLQFFFTFIGVIAGNTVWSMPEHLECEVLQKVRYINTLTLTCSETLHRLQMTGNSTYCNFLTSHVGIGSSKQDLDGVLARILVTSLQLTGAK